MKMKGLDKSFQVVGGDFANVNTGWDGGCMHWVSVKLGRNLIWLVCVIHTNELPPRHLLTTLDGRKDIVQQKVNR